MENVESHPLIIDDALDVQDDCVYFGCDEQQFVTVQLREHEVVEHDVVAVAVNVEMYAVMNDDEIEELVVVGADETFAAVGADVGSVVGEEEEAIKMVGVEIAIDVVAADEIAVSDHFAEAVDCSQK